MIVVIHFFVLFYWTHRFVQRKCEFLIWGICEFSCWYCCENDLNVTLLLALIWQYSLIIRNTECRILPYMLFIHARHWVSLSSALVSRWLLSLTIYWLRYRISNSFYSKIGRLKWWWYSSDKYSLFIIHCSCYFKCTSEIWRHWWTFSWFLLVLVEHGYAKFF